MDSIENIDVDHKIKKLSKTDLLDLKRKHAKMIREQPCVVPAHQPKQLDLDELVREERKKEPVLSNKKLIMEILRDAGVDVSKAVTINPSTYEESFNPEPTPVKMLKKHHIPKENTKHIFTDRTEFVKQNLSKLSENRKNRRLIKNESIETTSRSSDFERNIWNKDQKKAQILNAKGEHLQLYTESSNIIEQKSLSVDLFDYEEDQLKSDDQFPTFAEYMNPNLAQDQNIEWVKMETENEVQKLVNQLPISTQDIPMLCSGQFESQIVHNSVSFGIEPINKILKSVESEKNKYKSHGSDLVSFKHDSVKKKFKIENFIDDEAEQSGSDISLGSDDSETDETSIADLINSNHESDGDNSQGALRAHLDDMIEQDQQEIEAIKKLHFENFKNIEAQQEKDIFSDNDCLENKIIFSPLRNDPIEDYIESEDEAKDAGRSKIRSCLIKNHSNYRKVDSHMTNIPIMDDDDAILPEYSSEQKNLLTLINDTTSNKIINPSSFQSNVYSQTSFITTMKNKNISTFEESNPNFQNSNSACIVFSNDMETKKTTKTDSNDGFKFGYFNQISKDRNLPAGSIFSILKSSNS